MGRAGGGSHGGGHSSGGGHSFSRSSGGHRVSSSRSGSRARTGSRGSSYGRGFDGPSHHNHHSYHPPSHHYHHGPYRIHHYHGTSSGSGCLSQIIAGIIVLIIVIVVLANQYGGGTSVKSTIQRTKIDSGNAYISNCIIDELNWFDNESKTESRLKGFWEETGVQPYIYLKDYDPELNTNAEKEEWATTYYDENFDTENIFLFVYFAEEDVDNDVGYMCYANGYETSSVMDSEALEIFWNYIDRYWYSDLSTDDLFVTVFDKTGNTIMKVSTTGKDITKWALIVVVVIVVGIVFIRYIKLKNKRAKEEAEEKQKILETPLEKME